MSAPYVQRLGVRFDDVDQAQIVYFPRLFGYCHWVFEDFFAAEVKVSYARVLKEWNVGFPTVHAAADFRSPLRFGDVCRVELHTLSFSQRAFTNRYRLFLHDSDHLCAEVTIAVVAVAMDTLRPVQVPEEVRAAFARFTDG